VAVDEYIVVGARGSATLFGGIISTTTGTIHTIDTTGTTRTTSTMGITGTTGTTDEIEESGGCCILL
jgi:hypothetical protein